MIRNIVLSNATSSQKALFYTVLCWLVFSLIMLFIPVATQNTPEYETISLRLSGTVAKDTVSTATSEEVAPPSGTVAKDTVSTATSEDVAPPSGTVAKDTVSTATSEDVAPPSGTVAKDTASTATRAEVAPRPVQLAKSMEQLMAENAAISREATDVDDVDWDSLFAENSTSVQSSTTTTTQTNFATGSSLAGTAASASKNTSSSTTTSSATENNSRQSNSFATSATTSALEKISTATFTETGATGYSYSVTASTVLANNSSLSGTQMVTEDGGTRMLLEPVTPIIQLSSESENSIDGSRELNITFIIEPSGQVRPDSIKITPSSLLTPMIEAEIKAQISKWRFQTASSYGQVTFKYNIIRQ